MLSNRVIAFDVFHSNLQILFLRKMGGNLMFSKEDCTDTSDGKRIINRLFYLIPACK